MPTYKDEINGRNERAHRYSERCCRRSRAIRHKNECWNRIQRSLLISDVIIGAVLGGVV